MVMNLVHLTRPYKYEAPDYLMLRGGVGAVFGGSMRRALRRVGRRCRQLLADQRRRRHRRRGEVGTAATAASTSIRLLLLLLLLLH